MPARRITPRSYADTHLRESVLVMIVPGYGTAPSWVAAAAWHPSLAAFRQRVGGLLTSKPGSPRR